MLMIGGGRLQRLVPGSSPVTSRIVLTDWLIEQATNYMVQGLLQQLMVAQLILMFPGCMETKASHIPRDSV
jgi:hypothetical protein